MWERACSRRRSIGRRIRVVCTGLFASKLAPTQSAQVIPITRTPMPITAPLLDEKALRWLPWVVAIAFFMQSLDGTILNTALPSMARSLAEDPLRMQSVVIAYMLTIALLIPASGWIADRFGIKQIFF